MNKFIKKVSIFPFRGSTMINKKLFKL